MVLCRYPIRCRNGPERSVRRRFGSRSSMTFAVGRLSSMASMSDALGPCESRKVSRPEGPLKIKYPKQIWLLVMPRDPCVCLPQLYGFFLSQHRCAAQAAHGHSTVTDLARLRGAAWLVVCARRCAPSHRWRDVSAPPNQETCSALRARGPAGREARARHSTVTLFARFLGLSTSVPLAQAVWYASSCSGTTCRMGLSRP